MAREAPARKHYVAQKTITIKGGDPEPHNVYVSPRAVVRFTNDDPHDYVVRFFVQGQAIHTDVELFLPAYDSRTFVAGLDLGPDDKRDCVYKLIPTAAFSIGVTKPEYEPICSATRKVTEPMMRDTKTGGGGTIHVGGN